jgi:hypothetical protein
MPYCGKCLWTRQIPTSCLPTLLIFIHIEHTFCICPFLVTFFLATIDGRNLIFGHKLHIGTPYRRKRFLTRQDSYFLFAEERGYHKWALAHSSSCWIYNCLCNRCLSPLTLWVPTPLRWGVIDTTLCDKVCQWLATGQHFVFSGYSGFLHQ